MKIKFLAIAIIGILSLSNCSTKSDKNEITEEVVEEAPKVNPQLERMPEALKSGLEAHGSWATWDQFGTLEYDLVKGESMEHQLIDLKSRKVLLTGEGYKIGFDGSEVWVSPNKEAFGRSARFYHNLYFYFFGLPFLLADGGINYEDLGEQTIDSTAYNAVRISYEAGIGDSPEDYYVPHFNPETNQMEALLYTVTFSSQEKTEKYNALLYDNWQEVNGLNVPASFKGYIYNEGKLGEQRYGAEFKNVVFKEEQPDQSIFEIPAEAEIDTLKVGK
ncbi:MAG: DUF6503 family protein [Bacteroidota bacterium]